MSNLPANRPPPFWIDDLRESMKQLAASIQIVDKRTQEMAVVQAVSVERQAALGTLLDGHIKRTDGKLADHDDEIEKLKEHKVKVMTFAGAIAFIVTVLSKIGFTLAGVGQVGGHNG